MTIADDLWERGYLPHEWTTWERNKVQALRERIKDLEAELDATQANEQRLVDANSPLLAENYALKAALLQIKELAKAYSVTMFEPLQGDSIKHTGDYDTKEKRNLITRASAAMGQHMAESISNIARNALGEG